jgi:hypothetical protein
VAGVVDAEEDARVIGPLRVALGVKEDQVARLQVVVGDACRVPRLVTTTTPGPNAEIAYARRGSPSPSVFVPRKG